MLRFRFRSMVGFEVWDLGLGLCLGLGSCLRLGLCLDLGLCLGLGLCLSFGGFWVLVDRV